MPDQEVGSFNEVQSAGEDDLAILHAAETTVASAWVRCFGGKRPDADSSILEKKLFLARMVRFVDELEQAFGRPVTIPEVLHARTVHAMAVALLADTQAGSRAAVSVRAGGSGTPVFIFPGLGGSVLELFDLARQIRHEGPIYTNLYAGLDGWDRPHRTVSEMAAHQIAAIRAVQPEGPYALIGYSFGGIVALEVARRLLALSHRVSLIGMVEPGLSERAWPASVRLRFLCRRTTYHVRRLPGMAFAEACRYLAARLKPVAGRVRRVLGSVAATGSPYRGDTLPPLLHDLREASLCAIYRYRPQPFPGAVVFFQSAHGDEFQPPGVDVWSRYIPRLKLRTVPGSHRTILRGKDVKVLAQQISELLGAGTWDQAPAESAGAPMPES